MAEYSGAREQRTSGELTSATTRRKKSSNLVAPPSSSGKNENGICCPTPIMISPSGIKEAGKSIEETSKKTRAASTVESTALPSGFGEARRRLSRETNPYRLGHYGKHDGRHRSSFSGP